MRLQGIRMAVTTGCSLLLSVLVLEGLLATPAVAQVNVNVNIGAPPPVIVHEAPTMVFLSEPGVYTAVGIPYDIFFISGRYYYLNGNDWFWAAGYGGPWVHVEYRSLPPGLRKFKVHRLREFREREYRVYRVEGANFKGGHFVAVSDRDDDDHGKEHGREGHHRGKGKH
jgi:hypothetical protein